MSKTTTRLLDEAAQAVRSLDPGEQPVLTLLAVGGPSPWLMGMLGPWGLTVVDGYFVTLTERAVFIHRGPRSNYHPRELVLVVPLDQAVGLVASSKRGSFWSVLRLNLPGRAKPTRLNVSRASLPKMDRLLQTLAPTTATTATTGE